MAPRQDRRRIPGGDLLPDRCIATARSTGEPCRRSPVVGATVCLVHGARFANVKRAAEGRRAEAAAQVALDAILSGMNLDAEPVRDPTVALGTLAGRLLSGFEVNTERVNAKIQAGDQPSDYDVAERKLLVRELRQVLTDMTRLQIGVALGMQYVSKAPQTAQDGPGSVIDGEVVESDTPELSAPVAALGDVISSVLAAEHQLETDRLVRLKAVEVAQGMPAGLTVVEGQAESA